jgi:hypothetical protein
MPRLDEFYAQVAEKIQSEAILAEKWIESRHWDEERSTMERALRRFLRDYLPRRLSCGSGFVAAHGELSRQCDIIVYDSLRFAPLFVEEELLIADARAVKLVIEVKSNLHTSEQFEDAVDNVRRVKALAPGAKGAIYAYAEAPVAADDLRKWFENVMKKGAKPKSKKVRDRTRVPPEDLIDLLHISGGPHVQVWLPPDDSSHPDPTLPLRREVKVYQKQDPGAKMLALWAWILEQCRERGEEEPYIMNHFRIYADVNDWKVLLEYR